MSAAIQYDEAFPADGRTAGTLYAFADKLLRVLTAAPMLDEWAINRWQEPLLALEWLLERHPGTARQNGTVLSLIALLRKQGFDWDGWVASDAKHPFRNLTADVLAAGLGPDLSKCQPAVNLFGGDLGPKHLLPAASTSEDCERLCEKTAGCKAYVFEDCGTTARSPGRHCYLKSGGWTVQSGDPNPGCHLCSRVLDGPAPAPAIRPWFPSNSGDADHICRNAWMPHVDRQWTHGVNLMQAAYLWGLEHRLAPAAGWLARGKTLWEKIYALHGLMTGVPTGDECLSGRSPSRGTETCTVVETMMSLGTMASTPSAARPSYCTCCRQSQHK